MTWTASICRYNKPLQSSVRAVTAGTLWALKREDFREILTSEFSNIASLKLLRSIEPFSRLTILQLSRIAESLVEVCFSDGQKIIDKDASLSGLYIIKKGLVRLSYIADTSSPVLSRLLSADSDQRTEIQDNNVHVVELTEGSYFGEWTLFGESVGPLSVSSVGELVCMVITKEKFDSAVGSVPKLPQEDRKTKYSLCSSKETILNNDASTCKKINASDLEWKRSIYAADCCEIGLVLLKGTDTVRTLKRFSKRKIKDLGKEEQVMKEKRILISFNNSASVPPVLCTCADELHVGILLDCCLACTLSSILTTPLDENSARFCAASLVVSLEELHKNSVLHRGISPDVVMLDQTGHLQLVDFRFAKKLGGERTFTICGIADSLAPEIILGKGHGFAADWWALGVLIYFLLQAEMPFGSWRESELEAFAKISKGHLTLPPTFSIEVVDLITKLLDVNEATRLGSDGPDSVKAHSWFNGVDWKNVVDGTFPVPQEIISRIDAFLENHVEEVEEPVCSPSHEAELNSPEWLENW